MNLTKLFLETFGGERSSDLLKEALAVCTDMVKHGIGNFKDEDEIIKILFKDSADLEYVSMEYREFMHLKSEYKKYEGLLSEYERQNIWIIEFFEEAEGLYNSRMNRKYLSELTEGELTMLGSLCTEIENIYNSKAIYFIRKERTGLILQKKMDLKGFALSIGGWHRL